VDYLSLLITIAPVFIVIAAGYGIRRAGWLSAEADASLLRVVVNLLYPCLILNTILGNQALDDAGNILIAPLVGFVTVALGYLSCFYIAPLLGIREPRERRTFAFTSGLYNYGYIALPVVQKLFDAGASQPRNAGVLFIHNVGVETALWTLGIMVISGASPREGWKRIFSVPVLAIFTAMLLNFAHARNWMPSFVLDAVRSMGAAAIPLGLVLTGAVFADLAHGSKEKTGGAIAFGSCLLRLGFLPIIFLALARWLPCPIELRHVIIVQAAMPCAVIPVILAKHYGGNASMAFRIVLATSVVGLFTIPLWLRFGVWFATPAM